MCIKLFSNCEVMTVIRKKLYKIIEVIIIHLCSYVITGSIVLLTISQGKEKKT